MTKRLNVFFEIVAFSLLLTFALMLSFGKSLASAVNDGIILWATCVLPTTFPYLFITAIMNSMQITGALSNKLSPLTKKLFNTGGSTGYAFFLSILSGYPIGSKTVADLKLSGAISPTEAERASAFCSTSSPVFLIASVGNVMFENAKFGLLLFLTHVLSALLIGFIFSFYKRKEKPLATKSAVNSQKSQNLLYDSVYSAVISVLVVGGVITIFYLLTEILCSFGVLTPISNALSSIVKDKSLAEGIVYGLFESTKGLKTISLSPISPLTLPVCASICGFGGLSVIAQSIAYLKTAKIKTAPFIIAKLTCAVINFLFGLLFSFAFL
ncbi:MAG: hypothetical protein E7347_00125 [Clostridiales bacterium]|nr:hypothetical protein [Clostridiales bacterium]